MQFKPGVAETTTTTGTGTITLAQVTGRARFTDAFTDGEACEYSIEDGNNLEFGIGTYTASNQLARTTVIATLVSGTYDYSSPTPISLAAGTKNVYHSPIAVRHAAPTAPDITVQYAHNNRCEANTSTWSSFSSNTCYYARHTVDTYEEWTGIVCEVTGTQASSNMKCALYTVGTDGAPDIKIDETADGSGASAGDVTMAFDNGPIRVSPGEYFLAWTSDTTGIGMHRMPNQSGLAAFGGADISGPYSGAYHSITSMTFESPRTSSLTGSNNVVPLLALYKT